MANPVLGKYQCSDWFFLGQDFAVRSNLCIFVLERGRQMQHLQPKQKKKKKQNLREGHAIICLKKKSRNFR